MTRALSDDLRSRLLGAVDGGLSCNAAAERFGIAVSTAVRWVKAWRAEGRATALPQGGDLRSHRIEAYRCVILAVVDAEVDITLVELADRLRRQHGASFAPSTVWRFLDRHGLTFKKRRTPASRTGPTSPPGDKPGSTRSLTSIQQIWCSSTRPEPRPRWPGCEGVRHAASAAGRRSRTDIGKRPPSSRH
jgi:transposase